MSKFFVTGLLPVIVALAWVLPTAPVRAETTTATDTIEEIIVTSRRREESAQDVPLSVTAFGTQAIERIKPQTLRDFDGLAPNLYISNNAAGPGASAIYIRGIGYADIEKSQSPQVGVIVDGVQIGSSTGQLIDTFDVESIEVNRGPQGVLFGKNTIGGNIVVNRVRPNFDGFGFHTSARVANFDTKELKGRVNVPLGDKAALKVGAIRRVAEGWVDNITRNNSAGDVDWNSQTIALRIQPNDNIDATLTYDRIRDRSRTKPQEPRFDGDQPFTTAADKRQPTIYDVDQIGLRLDWDFGNVSLHSITAYHDSTDTVNQDFDAAATRGPTSGTSVPFAQLHTLRDQDYDVFTQELRLSGDINDQLSFTAGLYYFDSELEFSQATNNVLQLPGVALGLPAGVPCAAAGLRANEIVSAFCQLPNARSTQMAGEDVKSFALFGALYWRPIEELEISLGARWIDEEKDAFNSYFDFSDGTYDVGGPESEFDFSGFPERVGTAYAGSDSWDDVIITASANYALTETSNLYLNYSEGFRSGGFSIRSARTAAEAPFDPETAFQVEAGIKNQLLDRKLILNAAYFYLERDDSQFSSIIPLPPGSIPGTTTLINNGGKSVTQGVEAELLWLVDENWSVGLNGGFIDVDNKAFSIACELLDGCVTPDPAVLDPVGTLRNLGGNSDSRQPEWNYSVTLAYDRQIGQGQFGANVIWKHNGDSLLVNTGGGADQRLIQPDYGQLSARVGYDLQRGNGDLLSISVFGSNLTDKEWLENALFLGGPQTGFQSWGPPRLYSLEVSYKFGAGTQ